MLEWFAATLRTYPEIAIFIALALGTTSAVHVQGHRLGVITATLLAAVVIGQLGIRSTSR
jgi:putative transport protein